PLLQEIDADRWTAIARLRIKRLNQPAQHRPRHNPFHLGQKRRPPCLLGVALKPHCRQRQLLHPPTLRNNPTPAAHYITFTGRWLLQRFLREVLTNLALARLLKLNTPLACSSVTGKALSGLVGNRRARSS